MQVVITVDFGMTGTAAEWWTNPDEPGVNSLPRLIGKIPTKVAYDRDGELVAWGSACIETEGWVVCKLFKKFFTFPTTTNVHDSHPVNHFKKWTSDYLKKFCGHVIDNILQEENITRDNIMPSWHLTTPGCWSEPIRADFRELASRVLRDLSTNSNITVSLTEAEASAVYLVDRLRIDEGAWLITCDIGGATTDLAVTQLMKEDGLVVPKVYPLTSLSAGAGNISSIDDSFYAFIRNIGSGKQIRSSLWWQHTRHRFDASQEICLPNENYIRQYESLSRDMISSDEFVPIKQISIPHVESFFQKFLYDICLGINIAFQNLHKLRLSETRPSIALCGGGGTITLLGQQLKIWFPDHDIIVPQSTEQSCLATISGHRILLTRDAVNRYLKKIQTGLTKESSNEAIHWKQPLRVTKYSFSSSRRERTHFFFVKRNTNIGPSSGHNVVADTITLVWTLKVI